jgi:hypothetical protein
MMTKEMIQHGYDYFSFHAWVRRSAQIRQEYANVLRIHAPSAKMRDYL